MNQLYLYLFSLMMITAKRVRHFNAAMLLSVCLTANVLTIILFADIEDRSIVEFITLISLPFCFIFPVIYFSWHKRGKRLTHDFLNQRGGLKGRDALIGFIYFITSMFLCGISLSIKHHRYLFSLNALN